jgi:hypothetical protein
MEKKKANTSAHRTSILLKPISTPGMIAGHQDRICLEKKGSAPKNQSAGQEGEAFPGKIFFLFSSVSRLKRKIPTQRTPEERELINEYHKDIFF